MKGNNKNNRGGRRAVPVKTPHKTVEKTVITENNSSDESDTNKTGPNAAKPSQPPSKRARTTSENDMDLAFAETPSRPLNPASPAFTPLNPPTKENVVYPENSTTAPPVTPMPVTQTTGNQSTSVPPSGSSSNTISGNNAGDDNNTPLL